MDLNTWVKAWKNSRKEENLAESRKFWDLRADEFNDITLRDEITKESMDCINFLLSKGALGEKDKVLDIGCGAGKYSLAFAERTGYVTGIDISPRMVEFSRKNFAAKGLRNGEFHAISWQELDIKTRGWEKEFDLVFASMSPAVNSYETLMKMNSVSKKHCFLSGFVYREDDIKNYLLYELGGSMDRHPPSTVYFAFNILWQLGIYPELVYRDRVWKKEWPADKAVEIYQYQLQRYFPERRRLKEHIEQLLARISRDGVIEGTMKAKIGWLYWQVP